VYWENLSVSTTERIKKVALTYFITFICLLVAFGVNLGLSIAKESLTTDTGSASPAATVSIRAISIVTSFFVVFVNVILGRVVRLLSAYEKHETYSGYNLSVAIKLSTALFINTGIVPLFVNFGRNNWFDKGGLMVDIFYNTLSVCFVSPIFYYINPVYIVQRLKM